MTVTIKAIISNLQDQIKDLEKAKKRAIKEDDTEWLPYWNGGIDAYQHAIGLMRGVSK